MVPSDAETKTQVDDEAVLSYLKEKGFDVESFDDLKPKEAKKLTPEIEKFLEFQDKTGNTSYQDFLETQKDWSEESQETLLKKHLKMEYPDLDADEVDYLFNKKYSFDEEYDAEDDIMEKKINIKTDLKQVLSALEKQKAEFEVVRGSDESIPEEFRKAKEVVDSMSKQQEENQKLIEESRADYLAKTNSVFSKDFEGFKVTVGGQEFKVKPENVEEAKTIQSDLNNFNSKYFDEKGDLKDPVGFHKALHFGMNADKVAEHFINIGKTLQAEENEKISKNIRVDGIKNIESPSAGLKGVTFKVLND